MADVSNEFLAEMLRRIQADLSDMKLDLREIRTRVGHLEVRFADMETRFADMSQRIDRRDTKPEVILRRLDLLDADHAPTP